MSRRDMWTYTSFPDWMSRNVMATFSSVTGSIVKLQNRFTCLSAPSSA